MRLRSGAGMPRDDRRVWAFPSRRAGTGSEAIKCADAGSAITAFHVLRTAAVSLCVRQYNSVLARKQLRFLE